MAEAVFLGELALRLEALVRGNRQGVRLQLLVQPVAGKAVGELPVLAAHGGLGHVGHLRPHFFIAQYSLGASRL